MIQTTTTATRYHSDHTRPEVVVPLYKFEAGDVLHNGARGSKNMLVTVIRRTAKTVWLSDGLHTYKRKIRLASSSEEDGVHFFTEAAGNPRDITDVKVMALDVYQVALNDWAEAGCPHTPEWDERLSSEWLIARTG